MSFVSFQLIGELFDVSRYLVYLANRSPQSIQWFLYSSTVAVSVQPHQSIACWIVDISLVKFQCRNMYITSQYNYILYYGIFIQDFGCNHAKKKDLPILTQLIYHRTLLIDILVCCCGWLFYSRYKPRTFLIWEIIRDSLRLPTLHGTITLHYIQWVDLLRSRINCLIASSAGCRSITTHL